MRKRKIFCLLMFSFLISGISVYGDEGGLHMNSDYLKINNESKVYTSITDIYGVPLFTDETIAQKEKLENEEEEKMNSFEENLFTNCDNKKDSTEELVEKTAAYKLFSKPRSESKIKYADNNAGFGFISVIIIAFLSVLTGIFTTKYYKYKRKKDAGSIEYNNYTGF